VTTAQDGGKVVSLMHRPPLPSGNTPATHFCQRLVDPRAIVRSEGFYVNDKSKIRQQIGLEEPIIKEIEQNQLTWYDHVQRMAEGRLPKIALKWMPKQKRARGRPKKN